MIRLFFIVALLFWLITPSLAQQNFDDQVPSVTTNLWKVNLILPGVEYERALGNFSTININPYVDLGYSSNFVLGDAWLVQPSLDVQLRRYYNLLRRSAKGSI